LSGSISDDQQRQLDALRAQIAHIKDPTLSPDTPSDQLLGVAASYWLDLRGYSPPDTTRRLRMPVLVLQAERDYQVTMADYRGWVVRPRGEGDGRFVVFSRATDAVAAAAAMQQALYLEPWPIPSPLRVRMALYTGEPDLREGDYYGGAVNRCARLRAAAHGGQILLSSVALALAQEAALSGVSMRDLGLYQLRDLERPEHIFQALSTNLPDEFPPLRWAKK